MTTTTTDGQVLTLSCNDDSLWEDANRAAKVQCQAWMRATLREVALQALRLQVKHDNAVVVTVTPSAIQAAQSACSRVAQVWSQHLRQQGYVSAVEWMKDVVQSGQATLYHHSPAENMQTTNEGDVSSTKALEKKKKPTVTQTEVVEATGAKDQEEAKARTTFSTPRGRLAKLGRRRSALDISSTEDTEAGGEVALEWIRQIDNDSGCRDWPYGWELIDQKAAEIQQRLHSIQKPSAVFSIKRKETRTRGRPERGDEESESSNDDDVNSTDESDTQRQQEEEAATLLLRRKRKTRTDPWRQQRGGKPKQQLATPMETPRPPHDPSCKSGDSEDEEGDKKEGTEELRLQLANWKAPHWPDADRARLDRQVLEDQPAPTGEQRAMLLGALREVGHFHFWNQKYTDYDDLFEESAAAVTERAQARSYRQYRLDARQAVKERLGDHVAQRDLGLTKKHRVSHVMQTMDKYATTENDEPQHWMDLDLGQVLLDWPTTTACGNDDDETPPRRELYCFSSIEGMLMDEEEQLNEALENKNNTAI